MQHDRFHFCFFFFPAPGNSCSACNGVRRPNSCSSINAQQPREIPDAGGRTRRRSKQAGRRDEDIGSLSVAESWQHRCWLGSVDCFRAVSRLALPCPIQPRATQSGHERHRSDLDRPGGAEVGTLSLGFSRRRHGGKIDPRPPWTQGSGLGARAGWLLATAVTDLSITQEAQ
jgi:hypothetical protein